MAQMRDMRMPDIEVAVDIAIKGTNTLYVTELPDFVLGEWWQRFQFQSAIRPSDVKFHRTTRVVHFPSGGRLYVVSPPFIIDIISGNRVFVVVSPFTVLSPTQWQKIHEHQMRYFSVAYEGG